MSAVNGMPHRVILWRHTIHIPTASSIEDLKTGIFVLGDRFPVDAVIVTPYNSTRSFQRGRYGRKQPSQDQDWATRV